MDRKLRELQQELARVFADGEASGRAPEPAAPSIAPDEEAAVPVSPGATAPRAGWSLAASPPPPPPADAPERLQRLRSHLQQAIAILEQERGADRPDRGPTFEGQVILDAGPFGDIADLGAFEQTLAGLPDVDEAYVRSFQGNRALIDVRLVGPAPLVEEMRRALPFSIDGVNVSGQLVTMNLVTPAVSHSPSA